jgi:hypothetical protein
MTNTSIAANVTGLGFDKSLAIIENGVVMKTMMVSPEVHELLLKDSIILDISNLTIGDNVKEGMAHEPSNNTFVESEAAFSYYARGSRYTPPYMHSEITPEMIAKANMETDTPESSI